jgi:uncharacterized repeat protein (TIGR02543 family)
MLKKKTWSVLLLFILFITTCTLEGNLGEETSYTISFDKNGGNGDSPRSQVVKSSSSIRLPSGDNITKNGFTFGGWNTEPSGDGRDYGAGSFYTPTGNVTLYAKWIANAAPTYNVTFDSNGANGTPPASQAAKAGSSITLPGSSGLTKSGYTFNGWNTNASGSGTHYSAGSSYTVNKDITLYANWVSPVTTYTVTFSANGGSGTPPAAQVVSAGSSIVLPSGSGLSKSASTFGGWSTNASGSGDLYGVGSSYAPYDNITLYAKWNNIANTTTYTVTFNANGGGGTVPVAQTASAGSSIILPNEGGLSKNAYTFAGWNTNSSGTGTNYKIGDSYTVTGNIILYAKWDANDVSSPGVVPGVNLTAKFSWLESNAQSGGEYTIEVSSNESCGSTILSYNRNKNIVITLKGIGQVRTISLTSNGAMFTIWSGVTLVLDNNIILKGRSGNTESLIAVYSGGSLVMNAGSGITGNNAVFGGGVSVGSGGTFIMSGGTISGNTASSSGGGVYVIEEGTFAMDSGKISGNTSSSYGGGVYAWGTFTMNGGEILDNTAYDQCGGGVFVSSSSLGKLFTMNGGTISGNTSSSGGGVYVSGIFSMRGGEILGNIASSLGGGVCVAPPYVKTSKFTKTGGGTIFGYTSGDSNSNVVKNSSGIVQNNYGHAVYMIYEKRRETTAGPTVNLDSTKSGAAGGWE